MNDKLRQKDSRRLFIGISLPDDVRDTLAAWQNQAEKHLNTFRFTKRDNLHLTLYFLGNCTDNELPGITRAMKQAAANHTAFTATVDSIGIFSKKRILWAHVAPDNTLETLHADLANELNRPETRFASHITLVRKAKVEKAPLPPLPKTGFPVRELTLFESSSSPDGVVYTELAKVPLRTNSKA